MEIRKQGDKDQEITFIISSPESVLGNVSGEQGFCTLFK
jgi:hypothetical protein